MILNTDPTGVYKVGNKVRLKKEYIQRFPMHTNVGYIGSFEEGQSYVYVIVHWNDGKVTEEFPFVHCELEPLIEAGAQLEFDFEI